MKVLLAGAARAPGSAPSPPSPCSPSWRAPAPAAGTAVTAVSRPVSAEPAIPPPTRSSAHRTGWYRLCDRLACRAYGHANSGYPVAARALGSRCSPPGTPTPATAAHRRARSCSGSTAGPGHVALVTDRRRLLRPRPHPGGPTTSSTPRSATVGGVYHVSLARIETGFVHPDRLPRLVRPDLRRSAAHRRRSMRDRQIAARPDPADRLAAAHAHLVRAVEALTTSEAWRQMLERRRPASRPTAPTTSCSSASNAPTPPGSPASAPGTRSAAGSARARRASRSSRRASTGRSLSLPTRAQSVTRRRRQARQAARVPRRPRLRPGPDRRASSCPSRAVRADWTRAR